MKVFGLNNNMTFLSYLALLISNAIVFFGFLPFIAMTFLAVIYRVLGTSFISRSSVLFLLYSVGMFVN